MLNYTFSYPKLAMRYLETKSLGKAKKERAKDLYWSGYDRKKEDPLKPPTLY